MWFSFSTQLRHILICPLSKWCFSTCLTGFETLFIGFHSIKHHTDDGGNQHIYFRLVIPSNHIYRIFQCFACWSLCLQKRGRGRQIHCKSWLSCPSISCFNLAPYIWTASSIPFSESNWLFIYSSLSPAPVSILAFLINRTDPRKKMINRTDVANIYFMWSYIS
jgi:hypothetical protein